MVEVDAKHGGKWNLCKSQTGNTGEARGMWLFHRECESSWESRQHLLLTRTLQAPRPASMALRMPAHSLGVRSALSITRMQGARYSVGSWGRHVAWKSSVQTRIATKIKQALHGVLHGHMFEYLPWEVNRYGKE